MHIGHAAIVALLVPLAGCLDDGDNDDGPSPVARCDALPLTWFFSEGLRLQPEPAAAGESPGNGFFEAFLTDDIEEWRSDPLEGRWLIAGDVQLEFWVRNVGTPAPIAIGGDPGEAYHFFNQFGTNRTFQPSYAIEYADVAPIPGSIDHYVETFEMPPGGLVVEPSDRLRVLLTSLVLDDADGSGHDILFGGDTPSQLRIESTTCLPPMEWEPIVYEEFPIVLALNQGLLTGRVPPTEGVNRLTVPFALNETTERLTMELIQTNPSLPKDDMDFTLIGPNGATWSGGSPYSNERLVLWTGNFESLGGPGTYEVRVDSYSGIDYVGTLSILQETA